VTKQDDGKCSLSEGYLGGGGPLVDTQGNTNQTLWQKVTSMHSFYGTAPVV